MKLRRVECWTFVLITILLGANSALGQNRSAGAAPPLAHDSDLDELLVNGVTVSAYHVLKATSPFNMTGLPAQSVPFAFSSEQLPINIQLVSRWLDEDTILRLGLLIESGNKVHNRHPIP